MTKLKPINLVRGWPSHSLLPTKAISDAAQTVLADPSVAFPGLEYGPDEGYGPLRTTIAEWLTGFYQPSQAIESERIVVTGGASQNLACVLQVFTDPGYTRSIQMIAPAYMLSFRIFADNGFADKMRAVPEDEEGIDLEYLKRSLQNCEDKSRQDEKMFKPARPYSKYYRHVIYCVPTFSNPSSRTMSIEHRKELVRIARKFDALILTDDVYDQLQWPASPQDPSENTLVKASYPRIVDIDRELDGGAERPGSDGFGNAMSNGSFSKICGPGVRVGWAEGTAKFAYGVSQTGSSCSGGAPSQLTSTYMNHLLQHGTLQKHIHGTLQPAYSKRYLTLVNAVKEDLCPLGVKLPQSNRDVIGGYFIWLTLPDTVNADEFAQRCQEEANVVVAPGSIFEVPGDESVRFEHSLRLTFSWVELDEMVEGVRRMRGILESCLRGEGPRSGTIKRKELGTVK